MIDHVGFPVSDYARAKAFYEKTFEVTLERLESPEVELWSFPMQRESPGCAGALPRSRRAARRVGVARRLPRR